MGGAMDLDMPATTLGILYAVGVGPGDPELVTLKAVRVLESCPVVAAVYSRGGRPRCPEASASSSGATTAFDIARQAVDFSGKRVIELTFAMSRDPEVLRASHAAAAEAVCAELAEGRDIAMPILGDPSIYSTFHHIKPLVEAAGFETRVIPGVPSFCAVAATLGANLTSSMDAPLHVLPAGYVDMRAALSLPGGKVFMKAGRSLDALSDALRDGDLLDRAGLVRDCGLPTQAVVPDLSDERARGEAAGGYFTTVVVR